MGTNKEGVSHPNDSNHVFLLRIGYNGLWDQLRWINESLGGLQHA